MHFYRHSGHVTVLVECLLPNCCLVAGLGFSDWLVTGSAHVSKLLSVVIVTDPK